MLAAPSVRTVCPSLSPRMASNPIWPISSEASSAREITSRAALFSAELSPATTASINVERLLRTATDDICIYPLSDQLSWTEYYSQGDLKGVFALPLASKLTPFVFC